MAEFKDRLKELRRERGLSQTRLALCLNVSRGAISYYERGEREPTARVLIKAASVFNCSVDYLLGVSDIKSSYDGDKDLKIQELTEKYRLAVSSLRIANSRFLFGVKATEQWLTKLGEEV